MQISVVLVGRIVLDLYVVNFCFLLLLMNDGFVVSCNTSTAS